MQKRSSEATTLLLTKHEDEASRRGRSGGDPDANRHGPRHDAHDLPREHGGEQRAESPYLPPEPLSIVVGSRRRHHQLVGAEGAEQQEERAVADDDETHGADVPCRRRPVGGRGAGHGQDDDADPARANEAAGIFFSPIIHLVDSIC